MKVSAASVGTLSAADCNQGSSGKSEFHICSSCVRLIKIHDRPWSDLGIITLAINQLVVLIEIEYRATLKGSLEHRCHLGGFYVFKKRGRVNENIISLSTIIRVIV